MSRCPSGRRGRRLWRRVACRSGRGGLDLGGTASWPAIARLACPRPDHLGALLPDIDHPSSSIGRRFRVISRPLAATIGHRGVTHSAVAVLVCLMFLRWQGCHRATIDPLVVGYLFYLAADLLTTSGLRLAWPPPRRQAIPLCRTGFFG